MPTQLTSQDPATPMNPWGGPQITLMIGVCLGIAIFVAAAWFLPGPIVLPLFSVVAVTGALATAALGWWTTGRSPAQQLNYWDVAGAMTLVGVCAALLSDPEQAIPLLEARQNK